MKFEDLNKAIPYVLVGKEKSKKIEIYKNVTLAMPGRHKMQTVPPGGDYVVMVNDERMGWTDHQFTHTDIFKIIEAKRKAQPNPAKFLMEDYLRVVKGDDVISPQTWAVTIGPEYFQTMDDMTFLRAVQCLAVAEHRRYRQHENKFGGRYLPFRFAAGIAEGLWAAADAANLQKNGRPGVEILEKTHGIPLLTKELMS